jgi:hypothetical protein
VPRAPAPECRESTLRRSRDRARQAPEGGALFPESSGRRAARRSRWTRPRAETRPHFEGSAFGSPSVARASRSAGERSNPPSSRSMQRLQMVVRRWGGPPLHRVCGRRGSSAVGDADPETRQEALVAGLRFRPCAQDYRGEAVRVAAGRTPRPSPCPGCSCRSHPREYPAPWKGRRGDPEGPRENGSSRRRAANVRARIAASEQEFPIRFRPCFGMYGGETVAREVVGDEASPDLPRRADGGRLRAQP